MFARTTAAIEDTPMKPTDRRIPLWLKISYTGFLAVMIPVYWINYGPTNFLYFCDVALLLTLVGIWREDALLVSLPAVGILIPQVLWCMDFLVQLFGGKLTGMTGYMFDENRSLFLRGLSLFHGWLPFLLFYLVRKLGYDRRALLGWTVICVGLCLTAYFLLPPAGAVLADPKMPRNVNYVLRHGRRRNRSRDAAARLSRRVDRRAHRHRFRADPFPAREILPTRHLTCNPRIRNPNPGRAASGT